MSNKIIEVNNVSMMFNKSSEKIDNLKEYLVRLAQGNLRFEEFWALKDISFSLDKGASLGIVGLNGSGKSTLLKIIAKVMKPTHGYVNVFGSVAPLIELGAGFDIDLTARENIFLNGSVLGYSRKQMKVKFEEIMDFAELWDFADVAIKNYSSGMIARLGFSIATAHIPDVLIVDEVLGVGDYKFQEKCERRMEDIIKTGATIIFVSHSIEQVRKVCNEVIWLEKGKVVMRGNVNDVCDQYMKRQ